MTIRLLSAAAHRALAHINAILRGTGLCSICRDDCVASIDLCLEPVAQDVQAAEDGGIAGSSDNVTHE